MVPRKRKHIISHHKCNSHHWWVSTDSSLLTDGQCPISVGYHLWLSIIIYDCPLLSIVIHPQWFNSCVLFRNWFHFPFACFVGLQLPNSPPSSERRIHQRAVFENAVYTNQWPTDYHFSWKKWGFCRIKFLGVKSSFPRDFQVWNQSHQFSPPKYSAIVSSCAGMIFSSKTNFLRSPPDIQVPGFRMAHRLGLGLYDL